MRPLRLAMAVVALLGVEALVTQTDLLGRQAAQVHAADKKQRRPAPESGAECTPGYDPCIPPGSDVDCAGGSGNGPRYVEGPVKVTGSDRYGLDRDGDGIGCD